MLNHVESGRWRGTVGARTLMAVARALSDGEAGAVGPPVVELWRLGEDITVTIGDRARHAEVLATKRKLREAGFDVPDDQ